MEREELIAAATFCNSHKIELSFIDSLTSMGLIQVTTIKESEYINPSQLDKLEQYVRLHYDLDINIEGIDAISHLLDTVKDLQDEIQHLRNRLKLYERDK